MTIDPAALQSPPDIPAAIAAHPLPELVAAVSTAAVAVAAAAVPRTAAPAANTRRGLRILVVDDDTFAARLMRRLLEQDGHTVRTAGTVREALAVADGDGFDVLITDHLLPDGTGCELLRQLHARSPAAAAAIAAISVTGFSDPEHAGDIASAPFTARLVKPINLAQLNTALTLVVTHLRTRR